jgi:hypothetical protein
MLVVAAAESPSMTISMCLFFCVALSLVFILLISSGIRGKRVKDDWYSYN